MRQLRLIVVGSGIVGASAAYAATSLGAEVILVDAAKPGRATAAGAGIICPWSAQVTDPAWRALAYAAAREYPSLIKQLAALGETDVGYRMVGALALTEDQEDRERISQALTARRAEAPEIGEVTSLSAADARLLFPPLRPDAAAVYIGGAARVDGRKLAAALVRAAARQGAVIRDGDARLARASGRVTGIRIDGELIEGDAVIAATGAWTSAFLPQSTVAVPVEPQRGQIMHIGLDGVDTGRWPVVLPGASGHYLVAFDGGRIVAGATREAGVGLDYRITPAGLAEILTEALAIAPGLADGTYLETRVGFRPVGPDIRPLLGPVSGLDGLVIATGLGATGLTMGPLAGALAAQAALALPPAIDLAPFNPGPSAVPSTSITRNPPRGITRQAPAGRPGSTI